MDNAVNYRDFLRKELGGEYSSVRKGFDVLGNIAIIDAKGSAARKVAEAVMRTHKNVLTVLRKGGPVKGRYRTRSLVFVRGRRDYTARYNENGASFEFDVRKAFFSPRLAFERKRISGLCRDGEKVLVMFAGVGPFAIEIARMCRKSKIVAIELNRSAYKYLLRNIDANKTRNVLPVLADVSAASRKYRNFADRIIMPLPLESHKYLKDAFISAGRRCIVHYYAFIEGRPEEEIERLRKLCLSNNMRFRLICVRTVRPYSPRISEVCIDFRIIRKE